MGGFPKLSEICDLNYDRLGCSVRWGKALLQCFIDSQRKLLEDSNVRFSCLVLFSTNVFFFSSSNELSMKRKTWQKEKKTTTVWLLPVSWVCLQCCRIRNYNYFFFFLLAFFKIRLYSSTAWGKKKKKVTLAAWWSSMKYAKFPPILSGLQLKRRPPHSCTTQRL